MENNKKIESIKAYVSNSETPEDFQRRLLLSKGYLFYQNKCNDLENRITQLDEKNDILLKKIANLQMKNSQLKRLSKALNTSLRFKSTLKISEEEVDNILGTKKQ